MGEKKLHAGFCWGKLKAMGYLEDLGLFGEANIKLMLTTWDGGGWIRFKGLRIGASGGLL
jgi:hypothetical protein